MKNSILNLFSKNKYEIDKANLWAEADIAENSSNHDGARKIYRRLSKGPLKNSEDFYYAALSCLRLRQFSKMNAILEEGLEIFGEDQSLLGCQKVCCEIQSSMGELNPPSNIPIHDTGHIKNLIVKIFNRYLSNAALWAKADKAESAFKHDEAKKIYRKLINRALRVHDDYIYAGLASLRLANHTLTFNIFRDAVTKYPDSKTIRKLFLQACIMSGLVNEYITYSKGEHDGDIDKTIYALAEELVSNEFLTIFAFNYRKNSLNLAPKICDSYTRLVISQTAIQPQSPKVMREALFWIAFLAADSDMQEALYQSAIKHVKGAEKYRLDFFYRMSLPPVPFAQKDTDLISENLIHNLELLIKRSKKLIDPLEDMQHAWVTPWVSLLCAASDKPYTKAMILFEKVCVKTWPILKYVSPHTKIKAKPKKNGKIKIGFYVHDVMPMMSGFLPLFDKNLFEFYLLRPGVKTDHPISHLWDARVDHVIECSGQSTSLAIQQIAKLELDIIISGPSSPMIFYTMIARLATLQMILLEPNWLDGMSNHDYYISWRSGEPKDVHKFYSSKLALLKHPPYWLENNSTSKIPTKLKDLVWSKQKIEGVREDQVTYLCTNTPSKIHPEMDEIFLQILERDSNAVIILLRVEHVTFDIVRDRLYKILGEKFSRIIFLPTLSKEKAHTLLRAVDCCMDSFPICGMSSSFDALIMGIPVITLPFEIPFGKWTAAIYEYIGVDGLVARSKEDYISLCLKLANDKEWKRVKSDEIKRKASILLENKKSAKELEEFIIAAWERKKANLPNKDWILSGWQ